MQNPGGDSLLGFNGKQQLDSIPFGQPNLGIQPPNGGQPGGSFGNGYANQGNSPHQFPGFDGAGFGNIYGQPGGQYGQGQNPFGGFNPFSWGGQGGFGQFNPFGGYNPFAGGYGGTMGQFQPYYGQQQGYQNHGQPGQPPRMPPQQQAGYLGGAYGGNPWLNNPNYNPGINPGGNFYNNPYQRPMYDNFGQPFGQGQFNPGYDAFNPFSQNMPYLW